MGEKASSTGHDGIADEGLLHSEGDETGVFIEVAGSIKWFDVARATASSCPTAARSAMF